MGDNKNKPSKGVSRRDFLKSIGTGVVGTTVLPAFSVLSPQQVFANEVEAVEGEVTVSLKINGKTRKATVEPRTTLLSVLREQLHLTGAKPVCERGECGACTVLIEGKPHNACMVLAIDVHNKSITTVEGLMAGDVLTEVQKAFAEKDGLMCGFCTPGFVVAATALIKQKGSQLTLEEVKKGLSGNICRCGTYPKIFEAVLSAARKIQSKGD